MAMETDVLGKFVSVLTKYLGEEPILVGGLAIAKMAAQMCYEIPYGDLTLEKVVNRALEYADQRYKQSLAQRVQEFEPASFLDEETEDI